MTTCSRADAGACFNYPFLTQKERDNETGLDYFLARYYSSTQGRFTSPDEFTGGPTELFAEVSAHNPTFYADLNDPQSLNKYQYALNNPFRYVDPDGHQSVMSDAQDAARKLAGFVWNVWKGEAQGVANIGIGANNIGAIGAGRPEALVQPYEATNPGQEYGQKVITVLSLGLPLLLKAGPATVMMAESRPATVVSAEAANTEVSATTAVRATKQAGAITEPNPAPTGTIVRENGVTVQRFTNDHAPPHLHVSGRGPNTRIGQNGNPLRNNPALSARQRQVVQNNLRTVRRTVRQVMKEHRHNSQ